MTLRFTFDGMPLTGRPGDTLASALLRAGVRIIGRSFKYHRPRGLWGAWVEEPNAIFDVVVSGIRTPNCRATTVPLVDGMAAFSINGTPDARRDRLAILDRFARFIPAAFYYKTFTWPAWRLYEPTIRRLAGLGRLDPRQNHAPTALQTHDRCETLVIGAGPAGLQAALEAARAGQDVLLVDDRDRPGGALVDTSESVDGQPGGRWADDMLAAIQSAGGRHLSSTTAFGVYDHGLILLAEARGPGELPSLVRLRAGRIILATGAIERPLTFPDNDRPGIMSAHAGLAYLNRYGVPAGRRIVVASTGDMERQAGLLTAAGAEVETIEIGDGRASIAGVGWSGERLDGIALSDGRRIACDTLLVSGGWTPTAHLHCQTGGRLDWRADISAFVPRPDRSNLIAIGAAAGTFDTSAARQDGVLAAEGARPPSRPAPVLRTAWPRVGLASRQWIDLQNDVTVKDVELAVRENFRTVEHLKRYTTLGMANDQGKTSNMAGLAALATLTGADIGDAGTTTFRPPFEPVPLATLAGPRRGSLFSPPKRLMIEGRHRAAGATLREYGGWLRPAFYGREDIAAEVRSAREGVALFDASPLGKIDVLGPDAARFVDFVYCNAMASLRVGRARYGLLLTEGGIVFDDGVLFRLGENHFSVSCSSSHVDQVATMLDVWRQDQFDPSRVYVQDATSHWATFTLIGPDSRRLLQHLDLGIDLHDEALPHFGVVETMGMRVARVSFTGERSYEIGVPSRAAPALWDRILSVGDAFDLSLLGVEALSVLRLEKGLVIIGKDTDGTTMPHDLGFPDPRSKKAGEFVGKRSLFTEAATRPDRAQLVGLASDGAPLPVGGHVVAPGRNSSEGFVTSAAFSPTLGRATALALVKGGHSRMGETVEIVHLGARRPATIAPTCAFDPAWERLDA